ncbi:hypothetical protein CRYUN_Cryun10bG0162000 [Craigia yunnanensis]
MSSIFNGSPYRQPNDVEAGISRFAHSDDEDYEFSAVPFDITSTKNTPIDRLRLIGDGKSKQFIEAKFINAIVSFFSNLADVGLHASLLYYLKARFHFNKDQFADLMVITGVAGTISELLLMPILAPVLGEERLLSIGLFFNCAHVPYAAAVFSLFYVFSQPCLRSIVSKQVGPCEQDYTELQLSEASIFYLFQRKYAWSLIVGVGLMALQLFGGVNGIAFYASAIFISAEFSGSVGMIAMVVVQVPMIALGVLLIEIFFIVALHFGL